MHADDWKATYLHKFDYKFFIIKIVKLAHKSFLKFKPRVRNKLSL